MEILGWPQALRSTLPAAQLLDAWEQLRAGLLTGPRRPDACAQSLAPERPNVYSLLPLPHTRMWPSPLAQAASAPQQHAQHQVAVGQQGCINSSSAARRAATPAPPAEAARPVVKRRRAKKPQDAPRRPKSAYMFFLAEFRQQYKAEHPGVLRMADVGAAAGRAWQALDAEKRATYEQQSRASKDGYAEDLVRYAALHPKAPRVRRPQRPPGALKRPTSAYIHFLADFRADYKARLATAHRDHPKSAPPVAAMARLAGDAWARLSPGQRRPYEAACAAAKAEYARLKALPPQLRTVQEDGFLGAEAEATTNTPQEETLPGALLESSYQAKEAVHAANPSTQQDTEHAATSAGRPVQLWPASNIGAARATRPNTCVTLVKCTVAT